MAVFQKAHKYSTDIPFLALTKAKLGIFWEHMVLSFGPSLRGLQVLVASTFSDFKKIIIYTTLNPKQAKK